MNTFERYIWKSVLSSILMTWVALIILDSFFVFLNELSEVTDQNQYGSWQALIYVGMGAPRRLYDYFPMAALIGSLLGLGNLAANSELTAMRAAGAAIRQIVGMTLKLGLVLALLIFALGEWVAPRTEQMANSFKVQMQHKQLAVGDQGIWFKDGTRIINIAKMWSETSLEGVSVYQINAQEGRIESITRAETAVRDTQGWVMHKVRRETLNDDSIHPESIAELRDNTLIPDKMLSIAAVQPTQLAATELVDFIEHQRKNDLSSNRFEQAFWQHFTTPLSTLVMLIIAAPFVFSFQRNAGAGQRVFIGILIGIVFFLFNRILGNMGIVYGIPPLVSATLPLLVFLSGGLWMLGRVK
jgi:lipopolysaccharide export system permease protein